MYNLQEKNCQLTLTAAFESDIKKLYLKRLFSYYF